MSINLTDKLDEAIVEIEKIIRDKEKAKKSMAWLAKSKRILEVQTINNTTN